MPATVSALRRTENGIGSSSLPNEWQPQRYSPEQKWKSSVGHGAVRDRPPTGPQYRAPRNAYLPDHCGTTVRQKLAQFILTGDWVSIFCPVRCNHKREPNKKSSTEYSGELRRIIQGERDAQDVFSRSSKAITLARQPQCKANCLKSGKVIVHPQDVIPVQNLEWFHDGLPSKAASQRVLWPTNSNNGLTVRDSFSFAHAVIECFSYPLLSDP